MARGKAIDAYESYRRDGGGNYEAAAQLCTMVEQALEQGNIEEIEQTLSAILLALNSGQDLSQQFGRDTRATLGEDQINAAKALIPKLLSILHGDRSPQLADEPDLSYDGAVELKLLLERLVESAQSRS
jgi:hypothetical protein